MKDKLTSEQPAVREGIETRKSSCHPSRSLPSRSKGYGIGGGYERSYRKGSPATNRQREIYGPIPHSGYYGVGAGVERFERGQAGYNNELAWYGSQYGERTSGRSKDKS
jgi:hypothetical protein